MIKFEDSATIGEVRKALKAGHDVDLGWIQIPAVLVRNQEAPLPPFPLGCDTHTGPCSCGAWHNPFKI